MAHDSEYFRRRAAEDGDASAGTNKICRFPCRGQICPGSGRGDTSGSQGRERILQSLRKDFPSRYRQLVEQYYKQLGKEH